MPLLRRLVQGTDFRRFLDFVTPAFFEVMPARALFKTARGLVQDYRNDDRFQTALAHRRRALEASAHLDIEISSERPSDLRPLAELSDTARVEVGQRVLQLYFHQIYDDGPTLLNLSSDRFTHNGTRTVWHPRPGHIGWPSDFQDALRALYRSFYCQDGASLEDALEPLDLRPAAGIFRAHFGSGDQRAVRFEVERFVGAFHEVFLLCKEKKIRLHPAFLALGIYLATLYETLEAVGQPLDVRGAFETAAPSRLGVPG